MPDLPICEGKFTSMADDLATEVATRDGRRLAYLEVGNPNGPLVIHNHGGPSSRLEAGSSKPPR